MAQNLLQLNDLADIGEVPPPLNQYSGLIRRVAQVVSRCVMFLARFLINRQSRFNMSIVGSLHDVAHTLRQLVQRTERDAHDTNESRLRLQETQEVLQFQYSELQKRIAQLETERSTVADASSRAEAPVQRR
jgi:predicted nucleic acid-binding protein